MTKVARPAALLIAVSLLASCGGDDGDDEQSADRPAKSEALFNARDFVTDIEQDIVRRAKREDRAAGNDPAAYTYKVRCVAKSDTRLACRLDLTDKAGKSVNTVAYSGQRVTRHGGVRLPGHRQPGYAQAARRVTRLVSVARAG